MTSFSLKYKLLVLTVAALGIWAAAIDLPYTFKAGDVISAAQMNETLTALNNGKQDLVTGACSPGSSIRSIGGDGAVECETDDIGGGGSTNEHDHFGQSWTGVDSAAPGLSVSNGSSSPGNRALFGGSTQNGVGVHGRTADSTGVVPGYGAGVWGEGGVDSYGVFAHSAGNISLYAQNDARPAIKGQSIDGAGVWGDSANSHGLLGNTSGAGSAGVRGETIGATVGYGVYGRSTSGVGVYGESTSNAGVFGRSSTNNAAFFTGGSGGSGSCSYNGGAGWNCTSDRNAKENFRAIDPVVVLEQLTTMPISEWTMIGDAAATPHIGPTAQDFHAAFGLGENDTTINSADAQGVALAAIQGLYAVVQEQSAQIEALQRELEGLRED